MFYKKKEQLKTKINCFNHKMSNTAKCDGVELIFPTFSKPTYTSDVNSERVCKIYELN